MPLLAGGDGPRSVSVPCLMQENCAIRAEISGRTPSAPLLGGSCVPGIGARVVSVGWGLNNTFPALAIVLSAEWKRRRPRHLRCVPSTCERVDRGRVAVLGG